MSFRARRVADQLKEEISEIIQRELKDPRIGFVTLTRIVVSSDLKQAKVYVSCLQSGDTSDKALEALNHASSFIRAELKKLLHLKYIPYLKFFVDDTLDYVDRIETLIAKTKSKDS
jgi:ribosome-binding factor A